MMRILLIKLNSNGDCLLATPVARQIKEVDYPGCHLTWLIASRCRAAIDNNPYVDEILETESEIMNDSIVEQYESRYDKVVVLQPTVKKPIYPWGTLRSLILRSYGKPLSVPIDPILRLRPTELQRVRDFSEAHHLADPDTFPILFECSPQSGQSQMSFPLAFSIAEKISAILPRAKIILSSKTSFAETNSILDGSVLSWRENAELTKYCKLLIGCSSGITWMNYSTAAAGIPTIQFLNPDYNDGIVRASLYMDFIYNQLTTELIFETYEWHAGEIPGYVKMIEEQGFREFKRLHPVNGPKTRDEAMLLFLDTMGKIYMRYYDPEFTKRHYGVRFFAKGLLFSLKRKCFELCTGKKSKDHC